MLWLKRATGFRLYQNNDLPYIVTPRELILCYDNFFHADPQPIQRDTHSLCFRVPRNSLTHKSNAYYKLKNFPARVPIDNIDYLNDTILNGQITRETQPPERHFEITILKGAFLHRMELDQFEELVDELIETPHVFVLFRNDFSERLRALCEIVDNTILLYHHSWIRSLVSILASVSQFQGIDWIPSISDLSLNCYGFCDNISPEQTSCAFDWLGLKNTNVNWL